MTSPPARGAPEGTTARWTDALTWIGAIGIVAIAVMRALVVFAPMIVFDVDPRINPEPMAAMGPAGSLRLDVLLLLACAVAMTGEVAAGRRVCVPLIVCGLIPVPVIILHGITDGGDLWRGATWVTGTMAAVTMAHVARRLFVRRVIIGLLVAVLAPLLVRGIANVTVEYADTIAHFEAHRDALLADRGWAPGSPSAMIYERRLRHRQPTGWSVTTNIYAMFVAFGVVFLAGAAWAAWRHRHRAAGAALSVAGAVAAGMLWLTGALGAVGAVGLAVVVAVGARLIATRVRRRATWGGALAIAGIGVVLVGIVMRGAVLPEGFLGERSLLFRWHYLVSASSIMAEHPLAGVGPDGFQEAYVAHRVPRNPEEVTSPHSIFVEWLADLGVAGIGWIGVLGLLTWRAGVILTRRGDDHARPGDSPAAGRAQRIALMAGLVVSAAGIGPAIAVEAHGLGELASMVRVVGLAAYVVAVVALVTFMDRVRPVLVDAAVAAGALAVVFHAQIEMTLTRPGSVVWAMCVLGVAGAALGVERTADRGRASTWLGAGAVVVWTIGAVWLWFTAAMPAAQQQRGMISATSIIEPANEPLATPLAPREESDRRRRAAAAVMEAHAAWPIAAEPRLIAARQLRRAAHLEPEPTERLRLMDEALEILAPLREERAGAGLAVSVWIQFERAILTGRPEDATAAIDLARRVVAADPHGLSARRTLADVQWDLGRRGEAALVYEEVLRIDEAFELDPLKRLSDRDRVTVEARAVGGGG